MARVEVEIVRAFVDGEGGGNPAGFVLDGDGLSQDQRQRVAAEVGVSETAFVTKSADADLELVFHTPTRRIPHCGHATIAAFSRLFALERFRSDVATNATVDGVRSIFHEAGAVFMEQVHPTYRELAGDGAKAALLRALDLGPGDLLPGFEPRLAHNGNGLLLVPLRDLAVLPRIRPDLDAIARLSEADGLVGLYAFAPTPEGPRHAEVRMFAPAYGIPEEAATGMMAGPLGHWLHHVLGVPATTLRIGQGRYMDPASPSVLEVRLDPAGLRVGGRARLAERRTLDLPD